MRDCLPSFNFPLQCSLETHKFGFGSSFKLPKYTNWSIPNSKRSFVGTSFCRNRGAIPFASNEHEHEDLVLGLLEKERVPEDRSTRDQKHKKDESKMDDPAAKIGIDEEEEDFSFGKNFKFRSQKKYNNLEQEDDTVKSQGLNSKLKKLARRHHGGAVEVAKSRRQMARRSSVMAKQVISIRSALVLGFISQLWVDTSSWAVMVVEVRPNLLSGDFERFLLKQITQVGDVVLIEDENVIEDDFKLIGLETLVGYTVTRPSGQSIGKVRGYSFNINSGTVESLEVDSFGITIIPSSLVSTYALFVEDVAEVLSNAVVVHDAAVSRMQRLTKGLWNGPNAGNSNCEYEEQLDVDEQHHRRCRRLSSRKFHPKNRKRGDEWELPIDYYL